MLYIYFIKYIIFADENYVNYILTHITDSIHFMQVSHNLPFPLQTLSSNHSIKNGDMATFQTVGKVRGNRLGFLTQKETKSQSFSEL